MKRSERSDAEIQLSKQVVQTFPSHINRFGDYTLDLEKEIAPLDYSGKVLD